MLVETGKKYSTCHQTQVKSLGTFRPLIPVAASVPDPAFLALVVDKKILALPRAIWAQLRVVIQLAQCYH